MENTVWQIYQNSTIVTSLWLRHQLPQLLGQRPWSRHWAECRSYLRRCLLIAHFVKTVALMNKSSVARNGWNRSRCMMRPWQIRRRHPLDNIAAYKWNKFQFFSRTPRSALPDGTTWGCSAFVEWKNWPGWLTWLTYVKWLCLSPVSAPLSPLSLRRRNAIVTPNHFDQRISRLAVMHYIECYA